MVYFMVTRSILRSFVRYILWTFGIVVRDNLVLCSRFSKSGNPAYSTGVALSLSVLKGVFLSETHYK
jgi:hypothetical protein